MKLIDKIVRSMDIFLLRSNAVSHTISNLHGIFANTKKCKYICWSESQTFHFDFLQGNVLDLRYSLSLSLPLHFFLFRAMYYSSVEAKYWYPINSFPIMPLVACRDTLKIGGEYIWRKKLEVLKRL